MPDFPEAVYEAASEEETIAAGRQIAANLLTQPGAPPVLVVFLSGDLGAGKTTITRGFAQAVPGADELEVSSPTFTLIHEYGPRLTHVDLYRLDSDREYLTLGLDDYFDEARGWNGPSLVVIEWAEKFRHLLPPPDVEVRMEVMSAGNGRRIRVTSQNRIR